jgi:hypothetical protein
MTLFIDFSTMTSILFVESIIMFLLYVKNRQKYLIDRQGRRCLKNISKRNLAVIQMFNNAYSLLLNASFSISSQSNRRSATQK